VPEAKDYSLGGKDREEWDRSWSAMQHRHLTSPPKTGFSSDTLSRSGEFVSYTISEDPPHFSDRVGRESEYCPICGEWTAGEERLPATLHPRWASGLSVGLWVWVHRTCFESCPDTGDPAPIPW
jgi:hypothetical protein